MKTNEATGSIYTRVISWVLVLPLLVLAAQGGFSFEQGSANTLVGYAASGLVSQMNADETALLRLQRGMVYLICALVVVPFARIIVAEYRHNMLIFALLLWAFISVTWSQNPSTTFQSAILLAADLCFAVYLLKRFSSNALLKLLILLGAISGALTLFLVFAFPEYGLQGKKIEAFGAWQGIFSHKNMCGSVMTMLLLPIFFVRINSRYGQIFRWAYGCMLVFIIIMTRSVGAYVVCALCTIFVVAIRCLARLSHRSAAPVVLVLAWMVICAGYVGFEYSDSMMHLLGKSPTMTGRTVIWGLLLPLIMNRPLLGYGYMAFWQGGLKGESANVAIAMNWPGIGYSENGLIDLWLGLGAIAVLMFLLLFSRAIRDAIYCFNRDASSVVMWYTSILFFVVVNNIAAGRILYPSCLECILQIVAFVGLRQERRRLRTPLLVANVSP